MVLKNILGPKTKKLVSIMSLASLDGAVPTAAAAGLFKIENVLMLSILFLAGPGAILIASTLKGSTRERFLAALIAGAIATAIIVLSASLGPRVLNLINFRLFKIFGGLAIFSIGLLIMGIKIPEKSPLLIIIIGLIGGLIWR